MVSSGDGQKGGEEPTVESEEETESEEGIELVCRDEEEDDVDDVIVTERRREGARVPICLTTLALW